MSTQASSSLPPLDVSYEDDPRVVKQAATEDYSLHIVPRTWRMGRWPLTMAWYAVATAFFYMYFAAFLALAYGTWNALIGIVLTVIVYALVNQVILRTASRSGLTVALFSRSMFGFVGASIATLIFAATCIYYLVFEGSVIAVAAQEFFGGPLDLWYGIVLACFLMFGAFLARESVVQCIVLLTALAYWTGLMVTIRHWARTHPDSKTDLPENL